LIKLLLNLGADPHIATRRGHTALDRARLSNRVLNYEILMTYKPAENSQSTDFASSSSFKTTDDDSSSSTNHIRHGYIPGAVTDVDTPHKEPLVERKCVIGGDRHFPQVPETRARSYTTDGRTQPHTQDVAPQIQQVSHLLNEMVVKVGSLKDLREFQQATELVHQMTHPLGLCDDVAPPTFKSPSSSTHADHTGVGTPSDPTVMCPPSRMDMSEAVEDELTLRVTNAESEKDTDGESSYVPPPKTAAPRLTPACTRKHAHTFTVGKSPDYISTDERPDSDVAPSGDENRRDIALQECADDAAYVSEASLLSAPHMRKRHRSSQHLRAAESELEDAGVGASRSLATAAGAQHKSSDSIRRVPPPRPKRPAQFFHTSSGSENDRTPVVSMSQPSRSVRAMPPVMSRLPQDSVFLSDTESAPPTPPLPPCAPSSDTEGRRSKGSKVRLTIR